MRSDISTGSGIRLAELIAALSLATDLGMGQPMEFALSSCVLAVRLAEQCGYSQEARREVYYQALLRYIGCNAETDWLASPVWSCSVSKTVALRKVGSTSMRWDYCSSLASFRCHNAW